MISKVSDEPLESTDREMQSVPTLLHRLSHELASLFRQELALASAELTRTFGRTLTSVAAAVAGAAVLFAGVLVLLAAAVLGLSLVLAPWLAALVVGVVVSAIGIAAVVAGMHSLPETLQPKRATRSVAKDKDVLTRKTS